MILLTPFLDEFFQTRILMDVFLTAIFIGIIFTIKLKTAHAVIAVILVLPLIVSTWASYFVEHATVSLATRIFAALFFGQPPLPLKTESDLVGPEALQPLQRLVGFFHEITVDTANLLNRRKLPVEKRRQPVTHLKTVLRQRDPLGAPVDIGTLVLDVAFVDQLFEIVGNIRTEIVTARAQFARRQFGVANIVEKQRLH